MKNLWLHLSLTVKQNVLSVLIALSLLAAACGTDGLGGEGGGTTGGGDNFDPNTGKVWTQVSANKPPAAYNTPDIFDQREHSTTLVFKDGTQDALWIIGGKANIFGSGNDVWKSTNGSAWTQVSPNGSLPYIYKFYERKGHTAVVFNDEMWVMGGEYGMGNFNATVWKSTDGKNWSHATASSPSPFTPRAYHASVVFNDGSGDAIWVIGGTYDGIYNLNDVWKSTDGTHWTKVNTTGDIFSKRRYHKALTFNNALWVIGGETFSGNRNDVWTSTNGIAWKHVAAQTTNGQATDTRFSGRKAHAAVVFNNAMWVIGGTGGEYGYTEYNDVWRSTDGMTWTEVIADTTSDTTSDTRFSKRYAHTATVWNNAIWVIGGTENNLMRNDVWRSP